MRAWLALLCLALPTSAMAPLEGPEGLVVGHWLEVRGEFVDGVFRASRVELDEPQDYELLIGTVTEYDRTSDNLWILGQRISIGDKTEWKGDLRRSRLEGQRVKVEGRWRGPGKLSAREMSPRGPGRDRIGGRIDALEQTTDGVRLKIMRYLVFIPSDVEIECDEPLSAMALAPARSSAASPPELVTSQAVDEDDLFGDGLELPGGLRFQGQLELSSRVEDEFDLDESDDEDRQDDAASFRARILGRSSSWFEWVAEARYRFRWRQDDDDGRSSGGDGSLGETYPRYFDAFGVADLEMLVGRQDFDDRREWIYDQNLDAVRLVFGGEDFDLDLAASTTLADGSPRDEAATNVSAYLSAGTRKQHVGLWSMLRSIDLAGAPTDRSVHTGARLMGEWLEDTNLWLDVAYLNGSRSGRSVGAWGYDLGGTWAPEWLEPFSFTAGYAFGSGDAGTSGSDGNFRQTGLQDNTARFEGVTSFRYYGELFDPELSNMGISTLGLGIRVAPKTSIDIVYHGYLQDEAFAGLADADVDMRPNGIDADLGRELDVILGWREISGLDVEIVGSVFEPGDAFPGADSAYFLKLQLRYRI